MGYHYQSNKLDNNTYTYRRLPPVYSRDFAYADSVTVILRMARGNIANTTARSFAEYVDVSSCLFVD